MDIAKDISVSDVLAKHPGLVKIFIDFGLPCLVCGEAFWGTIEELAQRHNVDVENLVNKLNEKKKEIDEKL